MDVVSVLAAVALALLVVAVVAAFVVPRLRERRAEEQIEHGRRGLLR